MNVGGTANAASLGAPLVTFSTDYVFDGAKREPYSSPTRRTRFPRTDARSCSERRQRVPMRGSCGRHGSSARRVATSSGRCFALGAERDEVSVVDDQRGCPTFAAPSRERRARRSSTTTGRGGSGTSPASGDCTWADFAEAIFEEAGVACRVRRITTEELGSTSPRAPRTPCSGASARRHRCCRTGAKASAPVSRARWLASLSRDASPRHGRGRLYRLQLRPLLARALPERPCRRLRPADVRRQPAEPGRGRGPNRVRPG